MLLSLFDLAKVAARVSLRCGLLLKPNEKLLPLKIIRSVGFSTGCGVGVAANPAPVWIPFPFDFEKLPLTAIQFV